MTSTHMDLSNESLTSSQGHLLWSEIDMAERYLVSGLFEAATFSAALVLEKLCKPMVESDGQEASKLDDLILSAGMVLIQAHNENHCSEKIFKDLELYFGCIAEVPPCLLLAGICLLISSEEFLVAQLVLDELLKTWKNMCTNNGGSSGTVDLAKKKPTSASLYRQIAELYAVEILTKGLGLEKQALKWLSQSDIGGDDKKNIEEMIKNHFQPYHLSKIQVFDSVQHQEHTDISSLANMTLAPEEIVNDRSEVNNCVEINPKFTTVHTSVLSKALHFLSPVLMLFSKIVTSSPCNFYKTRYRYATFLSKKEVIGSIATFAIIYGIYRQRHFWKRHVQRFVPVVRAGFVDFWQLAFSVQLNPLAAVQQLPSVHYTG